MTAEHRGRQDGGAAARACAGGDREGVDGLAAPSGGAQRSPARGGGCAPEAYPRPPRPRPALRRCRGRAIESSGGRRGQPDVPVALFCAGRARRGRLGQGSRPLAKTAGAAAPPPPPRRCAPARLTRPAFRATRPSAAGGNPHGALRRGIAVHPDAHLVQRVGIEAVDAVARAIYCVDRPAAA